ncbi:MAG: SCP2 sterol-binding domain-containing protein [Candidatus Villigracilaceae bacterium]
MSAIFPTAEWLKALEEKLNHDGRYAEIARNWEGDLCFVIEPEGNLTEQVIMYLDLWHGTCRKAEIWPEMRTDFIPAFLLEATYGNFCKVLLGQIDPLQAMMTRRLRVRGDMAVMMRSVPTVLDFVRCAREITSQTL